ncbi:MAG: tetratricopeptide repeat protein [Planctomycetes bacterium]|nr:tetratricopeptide repeat protein [Planctomycetota bacterium]
MNARILTHASFTALGRLPDDQLDLVLASVLIAQDEYPGLRLSEVAGRLADLAARAPACKGASPREKAEALSVFLFREERFRGNEKGYYDPRNSFMNEVLERRLGIPITLTLVLLEVASRCGLPMAGVAFPGRFLARLPGDDDFFVDPFGGGRILTAKGCEDMFADQTEGRGRWMESYLLPVSRKQTLQRMLRNLKEIYLNREDVPRCLRAAEKLSALEPDDLEELRDRGVLSLHGGAWIRALSDLETYLAGRPEADDAELIRTHVKVLKQHLGAGAR